MPQCEGVVCLKKKRGWEGKGNEMTSEPVEVPLNKLQSRMSGHRTLQSTSNSCCGKLAVIARK